jgi:hypothetical protein
VIFLSQTERTPKHLKKKKALDKSKGKTIPLQAITGPKVFRRLRLPDFNTFGT